MSNGTGLVDQIAAQLAAVPTLEALQALVDVQQRILRQTVERDDGALARPWTLCPVAIRRPTGRVSIIESDPEIFAFITGLTEYKSIKAIVAMCIERFGPERSPSARSVHRFLQKLAALQEGQP